jgi:hypothetical protein
VGWGFRVRCPDCDHEWAGVQCSCWIGPTEAQNAASLFCPRCYLVLYFPKVIERSRWKDWYDKFTAELEGDSPFLRTVTAQVNDSLASAAWYTPTRVRLGDIACPSCRLPMEPGCDAEARLVCPECGSRSTVLTEFESHVCMFKSVDGFS